MQLRFVSGAAARLRFTLAALAVVASMHAATAAAEQPDDCLTGTDTAAVADDVAEIRAVRADVEATCVCSDYDGSDGRTRGDYKRCVLGVVRAAIEAGELREQCKDTVKGYAKESVCGISPARNPVPCARVSPMTGEPKCTIAKLTKGDGVTPSGECGDSKYVDRDPCFGSNSCIDAADTNLDQLVTNGDTGLCPSGFGLRAPSGSYVTTDPADGTLAATAAGAGTVLQRFHLVVSESSAVAIQSEGTGGFFLVGAGSLVDATAADAASATAWVMFVSEGSGSGQTAYILQDGAAGATVNALRADPGTGRLAVVTGNIVDILADPSFAMEIVNF